MKKLLFIAALIVSAALVLSSCKKTKDDDCDICETCPTCEICATCPTCEECDEACTVTFFSGGEAVYVM